MIKYNLNTINDWNFGDDNIIKVYRNNAVCYYKVNYSGDTPTFDVCYAVVDDITQYQETEFEDVFNKADNKWYKLNNLNQYEEYGVYGDSIETSGSSRLPQGYTEVEYVENTGNSTVNLGIQLMANVGDTYGVVLDNEMSYTSGYGDLQTFLTCCEEIPSVYPGWYYRFSTSTNIGIAGSDGINLSTGRTLVSGSTYHVTITGSTGTNRNHDYPLNLFSSLDSNKSPWRFCKGKLYNMQVTYNNTLVRDLVPCKNSSNVAGLYDLVNDVFYSSSSGYDTLVAGSAVTPTSATYYQGKLAIVDGYEYMYSGGSWVNVGEVSGTTIDTIWYDPASTNASFSIGHYWGEGYKMVFNTYLSGSYGSTTSFWTHTNQEPIEFMFYNNGFFYDFHNPTSTTAPNVYTGDYSWRIMKNNTLSSYENGQILNIILSNGAVRVELESTGAAIVTGSTGVTAQNWYNGLYLPKIENANSNNKCHLSRIQVYNANNELVNDLKFIKNAGVTGSQEISMYDSVLNVTYNNTNSNTPSYHVVSDSGGTEYPIYYNEKADPLNDLTFNTLAEAQTYAYNNCVYDGMKATIGTNRYYFDSEDENGWVKILSYYKVEDVTPNAASGWTITDSSTYNPDSSYYDDFDLETSWSSNTYKIAKVTIYGYDHFTYYLRSYHPYSTSYGYATATNVDEIQTPPTSISYYSLSAITNTYNFNKSPKSAVNLSNYRRVTYNNLDKTVEHTFYVYFYGRTYRSYVGNATILIPKEQTNENWEQVTFSASSNVASNQKSLYIDNNYSTSGGTQLWYYRWMIGLPSGSHSSYTNYSNYNYCPNVTSSTFTSVAGEHRQVNFTYDYTTNKSLSFRLTDGSSVLTPSDTVYYNMTYYNSCGVSSSSSNVTFPRSQSVKVGGRFRFTNSSDRHYIYGYSPNISFNYNYYVDNYQSTFDITYTKLSEEAVTIAYVTLDPSDVETPAFKTDITWPYNGGTTSSTTLTSYAVPYTYPYEVSQTSDKFSADSQSYTANQAARAINFVLYPNNREFATVADLEAYGYAWEGMIAYVGTDKYVYQNGEWVYNPSRLPAGYTEVKYLQSTNRISNTQSTTRFNVQGDNTSGNTYTLVYELPSDAYSVSYYAWLFGNDAVCYQKLDNGWGTQKVGPKYFGRDGRQSASGAVGTKVELVMSKDNFKITDVQAGTTQTVNYPSTRSYTNSNRFGIFCLYNKNDTYCAVGKIYEFKIEDVNGTVLNDYIPAVRDSDNKPGVYDIVGDAFYFDESGTLTIVAGDPV